MSATAAIAIDSAEHYVWGGVCDGWHLLKRDDLSVIRERVPAGAAETPHRHARSRQFFYVLEGEAVIGNFIKQDAIGVAGRLEDIETAAARLGGAGSAGIGIDRLTKPSLTTSVRLPIWIT